MRGMTVNWLTLLFVFNGGLLVLLPQIRADTNWRDLLTPMLALCFIGGMVNALIAHLDKRPSTREAERMARTGQIPKGGD